MKREDKVNVFETDNPKEVEEILQLLEKQNIATEVEKKVDEDDDFEYYQIKVALLDEQKAFTFIDDYLEQP
ncbi:hypothetical protein [Amniculibacterium aquaticum]|uniref:hypothetical protein n=1 Tax=Amniculibacterium aquaticum TaxID=2479858 RepID=UPI000F5AFA32|nr:hypothetical protein [Amniculibacterium aquaticum]